MKNKKGFTLVEMLLTGVLIAVIALIVVPNITASFKNAKQNEYQRFLNDLFLTTEAFIQKNIDDYTSLNNVGGKAYVYVDELLKSRYLKSTLYDTKNKKNIKDESDFTIEVIKKDDGTYSYKLYEERYEPLFIGKVAQTLLDNNTTYGNYTYMNGTYLKGVQESNYVWYNGFLWRIMGLNKDNEGNVTSVRLITEENVTAIFYGVAGQGSTYETNEGYINDWLNDYFYNNLDSSKTSIIKESDWCMESTISRTTANQICTGTLLEDTKVGLITLSEYNLSGASNTGINSTYGLVNSQFFWTSTYANDSRVWSVSNTGLPTDYHVTSTHGVRPVINVDINAIITGGNGKLKTSISDAENGPYVLNQSIDFKTGVLNQKANCGEYVSLSEKTYRVVSKDNSIGTKLIYDGYYEQDTGTAYTMAFGKNNTFSKTTGIGQKLNGDVLTWLGNSDKIVPTSWYQTSGFLYGATYTAMLNETSNSITETKVGLIRVGEMLSGQSASIITKNYTIRSSASNAKSYWTISKYAEASSAWRVINDGGAGTDFVSDSYVIRPVIYVNTSTTITSGNGTLESPYIID